MHRFELFQGRLSGRKLATLGGQVGVEQTLDDRQKSIGALQMVPVVLTDAVVLLLGDGERERE